MQKLTVVLVLAISGLSLGFPDDRIIGGQLAQNGQFPHMVSLRSGLNRVFACGGGIISSRTILTAAHCIFGANPNNLLVVVGTNKIDNSGVAYMIQSLIPHPQYSSVQLSNDIGLIILVSEIAFNDNIRPIELNFDYVPGDLQTTLSGWGNTRHPGGSTPTDLQWITLRSITNTECRNGMPSGSFLNEENLCTLNRAGEGICFGDSGSPVTLENKFIAVVSWSFPCANNYPDGHVRVSFYERWIKDNMI